MPVSVGRPPVRLRLAALLLIGGLLLAAWTWLRTTELHEFAAWLTAHRHEWYALPLVMLAYVVLGFVLVPVLLLIAATGIAFGPFLGPVYAMAGSLASASAGFAVGRWVGMRRVEELGGERIARLTRTLQRNGTLAVFLLRKVPAPFTLVNIVVGASTVRYGDFIIGTLLGMGALVVGLAGFGYQLREAWRDPSPRTLMGAALFVAVPLMLALIINHAMRRMRTDGPERSRGAV